MFANKQDLPNAMNAAEITDKLGLHSLRGRNWWVTNILCRSVKRGGVDQINATMRRLDSKKVEKDHDGSEQRILAASPCHMAHI